jgi:mucin-19
VSGTASVGAAVAVPVVIKSTTAWIGTDADVTALGQGDGLLVRTGSFTVTTTDPRFDPKTAVTGNTIELGYHHGFVGGELVTYYAGGGTPIGGLVDGGVYYVRPVSDTAIQLYVLERPIPLGTPPADPVRAHLPEGRAAARGTLASARWRHADLHR